MSNKAANPFRSARLLYVAPESPDHDDLFRRIQCEPADFANSNALVLKPQSRKDAADYQKSVTEQMLLGVVICLPSSDPASDKDSVATPKPIGTVFLKSPPSGLAHHRFSEIGIEIVTGYQGRGYGTEAIRWCLDWAFETAGLHRVLIRAFEWNTGARRLYEKIGFTQEGIAREELWYQGRWWDGYLFSMLDREWREIRGRTDS